MATWPAALRSLGAPNTAFRRDTHRERRPQRPLGRRHEKSADQKRPTFTVDDGAGGTLVTYRKPDRVSRLALDKAAEMFAGRGVTTATAAQCLEAASPFHQMGVSALRKQLNRNPPVGWAKTGRGEWKRR